jgi:TM2 domain-containing membrane protein YozV
MQDVGNNVVTIARRIVGVPETKAPRAAIRVAKGGRMRKTWIAYLLWFVLGGFGIHKFYVGKVGMGVLYLALFVIGWALLGAFGIVFLLALGVLLIIDLFTLPRQVRTYNEAAVTGTGRVKPGEPQKPEV